MMRQKDKQMLDKLNQERGRLLRQIEALQNEVRGLDRAIALCSPDDATKRERPKNVKETVLRIIEDAGTVGMNVTEVVAMAQNKGIHLEKPTVASHLSRQKLEGVLEMRDGRYVYRVGPTPAPSPMFQGVVTH